jgi:hypothetical protein
MVFYLSSSSRSITDLSSFINIVVLPGCASLGVLWAVTLAGCAYRVRDTVLEKICRRTNPSPSSTASTIPAVKEEQLSWLMSRGMDMPRVIGGSLSTIMSTDGRLAISGEPRDQNVHSSSFSTLFSMASAGFPNTALHTWVWMDMRAGRNFISRFGAFEADSVLHTLSSRTLIPILYPSVFSLKWISLEIQTREK